jgi:hypothetical protein
VMHTFFVICKKTSIEKSDFLHDGGKILNSWIY